MLDNRSVAEQLAREAERVEGHLARALRRASRLALLWPQEASSLLARGETLTELPGIGPYLARKLKAWLSSSDPSPEYPESRREFMTQTQVKRILLKNPSWLDHLQGDLQCHSVWSDGHSTVSEMAEAARERGYAYLAITDHSKSLKIAHGINENQLCEQGIEIHKLNHKLASLVPPFRILRSVELNLNVFGQPDMEPIDLAELDIVIGAFHSALRRQDDQTERFLAGLRNPCIDVLAHPTGRIYNFRPGLRADWPQIFAFATALDKAVEIDAFPDRQDLNVEMLKLASAAGTKISIGSDAHDASQLGLIEFGLAAAIEAGIQPENILNFMPVKSLLKWAHQN
jgi:histidinol phosphatase-like PHP family hydrolase